MLLRSVVLRLIARPTVDPVEVDSIKPVLLMVTLPVPGRTASSPAAVIEPLLLIWMVARPEVMPALNDNARPPLVLVAEIVPLLLTMIVPAPMSPLMRNASLNDVSVAPSSLSSVKLRGAPLPEVSMPRFVPVMVLKLSMRTPDPAVVSDQVIGLALLSVAPVLMMPV